MKEIFEDVYNITLRNAAFIKKNLKVTSRSAPLEIAYISQMEL